MKWNFDPVLFSYGWVSIHWYGVIFAVAIIVGFYLVKSILILEAKPQRKLDNLLFYVVLGVITGARLGHCLFYDPQHYLANPVKILAIWEGGLASHGGGIGAIVGVFLYSRKYSESFIWLLDRITIPTALFGVFVRVANFLNSEIIGDKSNVPWAVVFERVDSMPRHPAQLYESFGYLMVFILLLFAYSKAGLKAYSGAMTGLFLLAIFSVRFLVEYVKQPQASYVLGIDLNTGQLLSIPFLVVGFLMVVFCFFCPRVRGYRPSISTESSVLKSWK